GLRCLLEWAMVGGAGVVDEVVEPLGPPPGERLPDARDEGLEVADAAGVESHGGGLPSGSGHLTDDPVGLGSVGVVGEDAAAAGAGETEHGAPTQPAAAAGNDGDLRRGTAGVLSSGRHG